MIPRCGVLILPRYNVYPEDADIDLIMLFAISLPPGEMDMQTAEAISALPSPCPRKLYETRGKADYSSN